jgi:hypothetical protein
MASTISPPAGLLGVPPRVRHVPAYRSTTGDEAIELAALAGLDLDPWQQLVLIDALGERDDGKWAAFEVGVVVSRQNGKGSILEARELAGLFLLDERLIIHSAHEFATSLEAFLRMEELLAGTPEFSKRVKRVSRSHGEEGFTLYGGQRIRYKTRTKGGGRGFTGDCLMLDEAMILALAAHGALLPTLSARPNPQVWYTASAVDQFVHEHGLVLSQIRARGVEGEDPALAYFEWSVDADTPDELSERAAADEELWRQANPSLGIRISAEHVERERRSLDPRTFAVERLGVGDWPNPDGTAASVIDPEAWKLLADETSTAIGSLCFAFDVPPDRSSASIAVAGLREDGLPHVEVIDQRRGTGWLVERILELVERHQPLGLVCDGAGPAASFVHELEQDDLVDEVTTANAKEYAQACGMIFDKVEQAGLRHLGTQELTAAIRGATKRTLGDAWAWSRRTSGVNISPLVACTLALWGLDRLEEPPDGGFEWADDDEDDDQEDE